MARRGRVRWAVTVLAALLAAGTIAGRWWTLSFGWYSAAGKYRGVEAGGGVGVLTWVLPQRGLPTGWHVDPSLGWEWGWFSDSSLTRMGWRCGFLRFDIPGAKFFGVSLLNVLGLVLVPTTVLWWARVREMRGRAEDRCGACGYDRKGLGKGAVCPECGAS
jgi:hypothetical protein